MKMRSILVLTATLAALVFGGLSAARVAAHGVEPVSSTPAVGEKLVESPTEVVVVFPEDIAAAQGSKYRPVPPWGWEKK